MIARRQLPVASPISLRSLAHATAAIATEPGRQAQRSLDALRAHRVPDALLLTDSGTSALVVALRLAVAEHGTVGFPGYACVDLAAAARFAGVRVRLYDLDPETLSPDLASVHALLKRGVDAIVVAHLFGYPADVPAVTHLARAAGVPVIEDAAQGAGATWEGRTLGTFGDLGILSFGRGKGLCAGGGGALIGSGPEWADRVGSIRLGTGKRGWGALLGTAVQWTLGRPAIYGLPASLPWLHLGEMRYHPAHEPVAMATASTALLPTALEMEADAVITRRRTAHALEDAVRSVPNARTPIFPDVAQPSYLRLVVRDLGGNRRSEPALGIVQPYPRTLAEQAELAPVLVAGEPVTSGANELRRSLFTLPTHHLVSPQDIASLQRWIVRG